MSLLDFQNLRGRIIEIDHIVGIFTVFRNATAQKSAFLAGEVCAAKLVYSAGYLVQLFARERFKLLEKFRFAHVPKMTDSRHGSIQ